jgi:hypothetical protein
MPTVVDLEKSVQESLLWGILDAATTHLGSEIYKMDDSELGFILSFVLRNGLFGFDDEDAEDKYVGEMMPSLSKIFKGLTGRSLFVSNTATDTWLHNLEEFNIGLLGIGPGDIVAGDVVVIFAGVEQTLFFRPEDGRHEVLGDGYFIVLPWGLNLEREFGFSETEIILG